MWGCVECGNLCEDGEDEARGVEAPPPSETQEPLLFPPLPVRGPQLPVTVTCFPAVPLDADSQVPDLLFVAFWMLLVLFSLLGKLINIRSCRNL